MQGTKIGLSSLPQLEFNVSPVRVGNLLETTVLEAAPHSPPTLGNITAQKNQLLSSEIHPNQNCTFHGLPQPMTE